ncbi:hypothetical protein DVZ67_21875 [Salmonella enterica subsp. enterica serovar Saintpaul]|uniref:Uncharacterized protein n=1 Tax=Salmonella enterica TaxID=28901 RepID=A0A3I6S272_SALER|nr:hypothetical protein [Salmonella enterica]EBX0087090.1 hypothetical protein [Salmonella enterica subsp. enterica serovar Miami]EBY2986077.1 hypothetical protein [Salmonella enterica subsp. enterica serovar Durban]EBY3697870.1 hypothetical protein [Salmonella enterica subsp. enterica serovar Muenchen]ECC8719539.1 hypothetical protein [Salmonella enterica subsp. houtenae]ECC9158724.1 hypothetical protein [Salmonella enterica subsp. salamae]ECE0917744.1 hypothetical protein [Salmonella enteri
MRRVGAIQSAGLHNQAKGQHAVTVMSNQVRDLARQGWRIDAGEVLPLKQIIGLAELFGDETFSQVWAVE